MDSTIIAGLIGAIATITTAFITRGAVILRVNNPSNKIGSLTRVLLGFFKSFSIKEARFYKVKKGETIVDDITQITFSIRDISHYESYASITLTKPSMESKDISISIGKVIYYYMDDVKYRLTLLKVKYFILDEKKSFCLFEIRKSNQ